jgi:hypothetical protein
MSERAGISRTHEAVRKQIAAMGCERFDIGVLRPNGTMVLRDSRPADEIMNFIGWLRHENSAGAHIYIRPAGPHALTLLDDLTHESIERMSAEGCEPALVVETSPGNFQAWLKHAEVLDERVSTAVAKELAARFGGDPSSADWRHFGRLAGFTNHKPSRRLPSGLAPFVLVRQASGKTFALSAEIVDRVKLRLAEAADGRKIGGAIAGPRSSGAGEIPPIEEVHRDPRYGGDLHRADIAWANMAAAAGLGQETIRDAIANARDLSHKGNRKRQLDYAARTAEKALRDQNR